MKILNYKNFSLTSNGVNSPYFNNLTNLGESLEVMGKVCFVINEYINNNPKYKVYSIGGVNNSKENFYKNWISKLNITEYKVGLSKTYLINNLPSKAYYLII